MAIDAIAESVKSVGSVTDPDDERVRSALLLAYGVCMDAADRDEANSDRWSFAALAIREAYDRLISELPEDDVTVGIPEIAPFEPGDVRILLTSLIDQLATLFARAAVVESLSPWRRLAWSAVAPQLDRVLRELP